MLLATWNVNGIRARAQRLTEWLAERKPDVVCLQELKATDPDFPHLELRGAGYHAVLEGQQSWNGVAILAKEPPTIVARELPGAADAGARFIVARVGELEVASVYVPNGKTLDHPDYAVKLAFLARLAEYVEARAKDAVPFVLGGDFNVCRTALDSYGGAAFDGHIFQTPEERSLVARLQGAGLVDLFRAKLPADPGFTWWDYRFGAFHKKMGMRLDMLFATPDVAARVATVTVDRDYRKKSNAGAVPSDHAPLVAELSSSAN